MVGRGRIRNFVREDDGGAYLETVIVINILLVVLMAFVELGLAVNQWNLAAKATEVGARLAAVSDPVDDTLLAWTGLDTANSGEPIVGGYDRDCSGATSACLNGSFNPIALRRIVSGSDDKCDATPPTLGMCDIFPLIGPENVKVRYVFTGLGYTNRPGGPVPTIVVSLTGMSFDFLLLGSLLGLDGIAMPAFSATTVGEDMSTSFVAS